MTMLLPLFLLFQAPEPSAMLLAQAKDRCMATIASQQLGTADDEIIFENAVEACADLAAAFEAAIRRDYAPEDASTIFEQLDQQRKPNFVRMLRRIEAQRAARKADLQAQGLITEDKNSTDD